MVGFLAQYRSTVAGYFTLTVLMVTGGACGNDGGSPPTCESVCGVCVAQTTGARFVDNRDGTITDRQTCLMWEKKTGTLRNGGYGVGVDCSTTLCSDPHDVNNWYTWSASAGEPDGGAFTDFLERVNGKLCGVPCTGLGGHNDWRMPTQSELLTIYDPSVSGCGCTPTLCTPCVSPLFGPVTLAPYWSADTNISDHFFPLAFVIYFSNSDPVGQSNKQNALPVFAVRGGS